MTQASSPAQETVEAVQTWAPEPEPAQETEGRTWPYKGEHSTVYRLDDGKETLALKVLPSSAAVEAARPRAEALFGCSENAGLTAARRSVLEPAGCETVLGFRPEGGGAILMPWIEGPSWEDAVSGRWELKPEQCIQVARRLAEVLIQMELRGAAHGQICGRHLLLPLLGTPAGPRGSAVELIDLEQFAENGADGDRVKGGLLLAEILGWCDGAVRDAAWDTSYFAPEELHLPCERYDLLVNSLQEHWGDGATGLLERVWAKDPVAFSEWLAAIPDVYGHTPIPAPPERPEGFAVSTAPIVLTPWVPQGDGAPAPEPGILRRLLGMNQWWTLAAGASVLVVVVGALAVLPGTSQADKPFQVQSAPPPPPTPIALVVPEASSPGLNVDERWEKATTALTRRDWLAAIQALDSLREGGYNVPEVRSTLASAHLNLAAALGEGGDREGALSHYLAAGNADPGNPGVQEGLNWYQSTAPVATTGTATPTRTPTPTRTATPVDAGAAAPEEPAAPGAPAQATATATSTPAPRSTAAAANSPTPAPTSTSTPTPRPTFTATATATVTPPPARPPAPTGVRAVAQSCQSALVGWNYGTEASTFRVYRDGRFVASISGTRVYTDSGLLADTAYTYSVTAVGAGGESGPSGSASVQTPACR